MVSFLREGRACVKIGGKRTVDYQETEWLLQLECGELHMRAREGKGEEEEEEI